MQNLSYGEKAVGLTFNPSGDPRVLDIKRKAAVLIDALKDQFDMATDGEVKAQLMLSIRQAQQAQMWGVKAITWDTTEQPTRPVTDDTQEEPKTSGNPVPPTSTTSDVPTV